LEVPDAEFAYVHVGVFAELDDEDVDAVHGFHRALWVCVGVYIRGLAEFFDFDFDGFGVGVCSFECFREAEYNVGEGFLHHVVQRQLFSVNPKFGFKVFLYDPVGLIQNLSPLQRIRFSWLIKFV
jgi:hypothetical protein